MKPGPGKNVPEKANPPDPPDREVFFLPAKLSSFFKQEFSFPVRILYILTRWILT
jgi:hypothetical protein